jgi:hypothetical protein
MRPNWERERHQDRAASTKAVLSDAVMSSPTHIVPILVGDPERCKTGERSTPRRSRVYIQPINYPTVLKAPNGRASRRLLFTTIRSLTRAPKRCSPCGGGSSCRSNRPPWCGSDPVTPPGYVRQHPKLQPELVAVLVVEDPTLESKGRQQRRVRERITVQKNRSGEGD